MLYLRGEEGGEGAGRAPLAHLDEHDLHRTGQPSLGRTLPRRCAQRQQAPLQRPQWPLVRVQRQRGSCMQGGSPELLVDAVADGAVDFRPGGPVLPRGAAPPAPAGCSAAAPPTRKNRNISGGACMCQSLCFDSPADQSQRHMHAGHNGQLLARCGCSSPLKEMPSLKQQPRAVQGLHTH